MRAKYRTQKVWQRLIAPVVVALASAGLAAGPAAAANARVVKSGTAAPAQAAAVRLGAEPATRQLSIAVTLPLRDRPELDALIADVSNPASPDYGHYLTPGEFTARFAPTAAQVEAVQSFLTSQGLTVGRVSSNRTVIDASGSVADLNRAFGTTISRYHDPHLNRDYFANDQPVSLPASISPDVLAVVGLNDHFTHEHPPVPTQAPRAGGGPAGGYTPTQLRGAYDLNPLTTAGVTGTGQNIGLFELDGFTQSNISTYDSQYGLNSPAPTVSQVDGGSGALGQGEVEVELDIEVVQAVASGAHVTVFEGPNSDQGVIDTYNAMATADTTKANSTSWGECEASSNSSTITSEDNIYAQMAAQGQTLYAASGDSAAYDCGTSGQLGVDNPADDPNVTGVGGTNLQLSGSTYGSESAWHTSATEGGGGGVSTIFAKPSWQSAPGMPSNCTKRCVPDVSSDADPASGYSIYSTGSWQVVGGTSAAAPMWAGFTALYNQDAANGGHALLGFANPVLYSLDSNAQTYAPFHDVTSGYSSTATNWPATSGYDLATGIGSYDANNLARDLLGTGTTTNDFAIASNPSSVSVTPGSSTTASITTAVASGSAGSVSLAASGAPAGVTATLSPASVTAGGSSTLTLSTSSSTAPGTYPITVAGTEGTVSHSTTVTLTVGSGSGGGSCSSSQLLGNPGFETGTASPWTASSGVLNNSSSEPPHAGSWDAWLDGYGSSHSDTLSQTVAIPAGCNTSTLSFWLHVDTAETSASAANDTLSVQLLNGAGTVLGTLATFSNLNAASGYAQHSFNVGSYAGQTVTLKLTGTENASLQTSFVVDDLALNATGAAAANTVSVTNPGSQSSTVGTAASLQIQAADSASGQTLTYSALGLPPGLAIRSATGLISGTPTAAGTYSVAVTATDGTGASGSATFNWTVGSGTSNTVTVTNPGNQTSTSGSAISPLQIRGADSAAGQTLTYSATGLPAGLSISAGGQITGTPTTAGSYSVTVAARDSTGASGSTTFTWTVSAAAGCTAAQLIKNPGFESGASQTAWTWSSTKGSASDLFNSTSSEPPHSGTYDAWLNGWGATDTDTLSQTVTIPASCASASFSFWLHIDTAETTTSTAYDTLKVQVLNSAGTLLSTLHTYSNLNAASGFQQHSFSLASYSGQAVTLKFTGAEDSSNQTSFVLDDTAVNVS